MLGKLDVEKWELNGVGVSTVRTIELKRVDSTILRTEVMSEHRARQSSPPILAFKRDGTPTGGGGGFGEVAVRAAGICKRDPGAEPLAAWQKAVKEVFPDSASMREKSSPRATFLGLCEAGLVLGVPPGRYTRSKLNKAYALKAVSLLRGSPSLASNPLTLWAEVMAGEPKSPNGQAEVVIALWEAGMVAAKIIP